MSAVARSSRPSFSPLGHWNQVPVAETQRCLREAFTVWGRPQRLRVDNGTPWGPGDDLPTPLALWLCGLGVELVLNPPRQPKDNGVVERSQGTGKRWAEPERCDCPEELQAHLEEMDRIQRELYPRRQDGQSRQEAYPELAHSGRPYGVAWERCHWDLSLVDAWLSTLVVRRLVDVQGKVSMYGRKRFVGKHWANTTLFVGYDPEDRAWTYRDSEAHLLQKHPAQEITRERIMKLALLDDDPKTAKPRVAKKRQN